MLNAYDLKEVLDVLHDSEFLTEQPTYDVFLDLLDVINRNIRDSAGQRRKEKMVRRAEG